MSEPITSCNNKLRWKFENVSTLDGNTRYSDEIDIDGVKWKIGIKKTSIDDTDRLFAFLNCIIDEKEKSWICAVDAKFYLLKKQELCGAESLKNTKYFMNENNEFGEKMVAFTWDQIVDASHEFIENDSICVQFNFDFIFQNFSKSIENHTDIILKVEGTEIHCKKELLCSNSKYFHNLLIVEKSDYTKIEIDEDVKLKDFLFLLFAIEPKTYLPHSKMLECLETANRFDVHTIPMNIASGMYSVLEYKKTFDKNDIDLKYIFECIKFADKYGYEKLMTMAMSSFKSSKDVKQFSELDEFSKLAKNTKLMVLNRILEIL